MTRICTTVALLGAIIQVATPQSSSGSWKEKAQGSASVGWRPASFRGLQVGKATKDDVLRVLGKPQREWTEPDGLTYLHYDNAAPPKGVVDVAIFSTTRSLESVAVVPESMSVKELVRMLGSEYELTRWSSASCLRNESGDEPSYLDPKGSSLVMEYRGLGVAVQFEGDRVRTILYSRGIPLGYDKNPCTDKTKK
jgi:hypothetical protein